MKTPLLLAIAVALLPALPAHAAKIAFSTDLAGKYRGTYFAQSGGEPASGTVTVKVRVPRSGRSATIGINGIISSNQITIPVQCELRLKGNGKLKANSSLMGLYGPSATKPSRLKGRKSPFKFRLVAGPGANLGGEPLIASMKYTLRFSRDAISINGTGRAGLGDTTLPFTVSIEADK